MKKLYFFLTILISNLVVAQSSAGDNLFNTLQVHEIYINFVQTDYWNLLVTNKSLDDSNNTSSYIPAEVIMDGVTLSDNVGIQFKGNSSYYNYPSNKKPFTLSFNEYNNDQLYDGLKSLNLNNMYQDPSFMREKLFLDFLNEKGLYAPRANYAKLYINNVYWGLYYVSERVNKTFAQDRFGNNDGNLFKGDGNSGACANLEYHGVLSPYYNCYTLKTNETENDWSDLINLTQQINMTSDAEFKDAVDVVLNANSFIGSWAACNMFVNFDSYAFRFVHNYYIYHNLDTDRFEWITWDVSTAFGMDVPGTVASIENKSILYIEPDAADRPLANRMLANTEYKNKYLAYMCDFIDSFQPSLLNPKIDNIYNLIKDDVYSDPLKMYSNSNFDNNINSNIVVGGTTYPGLKSFIQNRSANIQNELATLNVDCASLLTVSLNTIEQMAVYPNPVESVLSISIPGQTYNIKIFDMTGRMILNLSQINVFASVNCQQFTNGMYFIEASNERMKITKKFLKK